MTTEIIVDNFSLWFLVIGLLIGLVIMLIFVSYVLISNSIHSSYHKGYNQAKNDKVHYFSTIHDLTESFDDIYTSIQSLELNLPFDLTSGFISYRELLKKFRER